MANVGNTLGSYRVRPARATGPLGPIASAVRAWMDRHRQRRALNLLDDKMLEDIGLTRLDVEHEIRKPFWQA